MHGGFILAFWTVPNGNITRRLALDTYKMVRDNVMSQSTTAEQQAEATAASTRFAQSFFEHMDGLTNILALNRENSPAVRELKEQGKCNYTWDDGTVVEVGFEEVKQWQLLGTKNQWFYVQAKWETVLPPTRIDWSHPDTKAEVNRVFQGLLKEREQELWAAIYRFMTTRDANLSLHRSTPIDMGEYLPGFINEKGGTLDNFEFPSTLELCGFHDRAQELFMAQGEAVQEQE
eukprot:comp46740_c0_seq1/m.47585 comp46740_c0_seq1/g.47585  ORF comp46740_c0_seq1/g.47585 comp46740_c0_seq1/m.47585 type:complete len:232 (-) comp46740_c0_seq1:359-1054(-)